MKNMVVLIDTNILLNYITNREDDPAVTPKEFFQM